MARSFLWLAVRTFVERSEIFANVEFDVSLPFRFSDLICRSLAVSHPKKS